MKQCRLLKGTKQSGGQMDARGRDRPRETGRPAREDVQYHRLGWRSRQRASQSDFVEHASPARSIALLILN